MKYLLTYEKKNKVADITPPISKSILNRYLIISALEDINKVEDIKVDEAEDSIWLKDSILNKQDLIQTGEGGTTYRFLLAYKALTTHKPIVLTPSAPMMNRPIGPLVTILKSIGADITYLGEDGHPPVRISPSKLTSSENIYFPAHISSQFISALLLIAPYLESSINIHLVGKIVSKPYLLLTIGMMRNSGINISYDKLANSILVETGKYNTSSLILESDWSAVSYFIGFVLVSPHPMALTLNNLSKDSLQADIRALKIGELFGLTYTFADHNLKISKKEKFHLPHEVFINFIDCPDIAQTFICVAAALQVNMTFKGITTLFDKETNRLKALQNELEKLNCTIKRRYIDEDERNDAYFLDTSKRDLKKGTQFSTYNDHRMAMSLSILSTLDDIYIENPEVVGKSYKNFWIDILKLGITIESINP